MRQAPVAPSPPTPAEVEALWHGWKQRADVRARDQLVLTYAPMVNYLATRKVRELPSHCELEDLISAGLVELVAAVDRFDPTRGVTFEQYVWTRITGAIMDELRRQDWAPRSVRSLAREVDDARDRWVARTGGRPPTDQELAKELDIDLSEVRTKLQALERTELLSLNNKTRRGHETLAIEIGDLLEAAPGNHEPERALLSKERLEVLRKAVAELSERERTVLELVHVRQLGGAEVGRRLGVGESRVSQILSSIRSRLKEELAAYDATASKH